MSAENGEVLSTGETTGQVLNDILKEMIADLAKQANGLTDSKKSAQELLVELNKSDLPDKIDRLRRLLTGYSDKLTSLVKDINNCKEEQKKVLANLINADLSPAEKKPPNKVKENISTPTWADMTARDNLDASNESDSGFIRVVHKNQNPKTNVKLGNNGSNHSVPCRYGAKCTKGTKCTFYHPGGPLTLTPANVNQALFYSYEDESGNGFGEAILSAIREIAREFLKKHDHDYAPTMVLQDDVSFTANGKEYAVTCRYRNRCMSKDCTFYHANGPLSVTPMNVEHLFFTDWEEVEMNDPIFLAIAKAIIDSI